MSTKLQLDHNNRPVPDDETPETVIKVWRVYVVPQQRFDYVCIRGWQHMLDFVRDETERALEHAETDDELRDGVTVKVGLYEMTRGEYDALDTD